MEQQQLRAIWTRARRLLEDALPEISFLMKAKFAAVGTPTPGDTLIQNGLQDGVAIVEEFLQHNELGLALEHLCYMVYEAELPISAHVYACLEAAGTEMQMDARLWQSLHPALKPA